MPETAGQVADGFADAVREHEEQWLSPLAVRSYETRGREAPEEDLVRGDAAFAVGLGQQLLGDDTGERVGEQAADLRLLIGGERVDVTIDRR